MATKSSPAFRGFDTGAGVGVEYPNIKFFAFASARKTIPANQRKEFGKSCGACVV
jgi:hypothetical protein